jgi:hypothetical protein
LGRPPLELIFSTAAPPAVRPVVAQCTLRELLLWAHSTPGYALEVRAIVSAASDDARIHRHVAE